MEFLHWSFAIRLTTKSYRDLNRNYLQKCLIQISLNCRGVCKWFFATLQSLDMWLQLVVFCVILRLQATWAFSSGAGTSACESITPSHPPHEPQISMAPIILTLSTQNLRQGETMTLTIEAQEDFAFRGFMIQARTLAENSQVVGRFLERDNMRTVSCLTLAEESVATHINAALKTRIEFTWQAETTFIGIINFQ